MRDTDPLTIGAWLPNDWYRKLSTPEQRAIRESDIDLLLVPENHDEWEERVVWRELAENIETAIFVGLADGDWARGLFYDPISGIDTTYTKHSTAGKLAFEKEDWIPETALDTISFRDIILGTTICQDSYFSPLMGFQGVAGAQLLVNLSASPVQRRKWGEVLQARAIENSSYVVCTMHSTWQPGTSGGGNGHVFAFDPLGDVLPLTELSTNNEYHIFETGGDNIYKVRVDVREANRAKGTLREQLSRPPIERIKTNVYGDPGPSDSTVDVRVLEDELEFTYHCDAARIALGDSQSFKLGDEQFYVVVLNEEEVLEPERMYDELFSVPDIVDQTVLIHNHWTELDTNYLENVVEPVLRARTVEWASPSLLTCPSAERGYQGWYTKKTHRVPTDADGNFNFDIRWATGVEAALGPVENQAEPLSEVASMIPDKRGISAH